MSRPYQFGDKEERVTSPLDRRAANPYPAGQAPSFKTNVNRAKTKKWVEAKAPSYGGDDWDEYDEDDEYGVESARDQPLPPLPDERIQQNPGRSFTQPIPPMAKNPRRNSFDAGDERRAFSSSAFPPPNQGQNPTQSPEHSGPPRSPAPLHVETSVAAAKSPATDSPSIYATRLPSASSDLSSTTPEHRRDFSPSALPTPLRTGGSTVTSPTGQFPPPQANVDQRTNLPVAQQALPVEPPLASSPPPSFIRPADIYKRHLEEEQRRSLESQRQSLDSNRSQEMTSPTQARAPLETVAERKSEYSTSQFPAETTPKNITPSRSSFAGLALPNLGGESNFGDEFWSSTMGGSSAGGLTATAPAATSAHNLETHDSALQHQPSLGFTSLVHQGFDAATGVSKQDSLRSQADATDSSVSRSNTTGTSDISPIMSRVPSSANAAAGAKLAERRGATPMIEEEPEAGERASRPVSLATQPNEGHIPIGFTPGYRRDLTTPSPNNSPARSPAVESNKQLPAYGVAEVAADSPAIKPLDKSTREADIVEAIASNPDKDATFLASSEKAAQGAFLESHKPDIPAASPKITRSESPSKGRVADLAGRFDDGSDSRRRSVESLGSDKSASAVTNKDDTSVTLKPTDRPQAERELSFRPKLPGAFESFVSDRSNSPVKVTVDSSQAAATKPDNGELSDVDFAPTSAKHTVKGKNLSESAGPMAALAAAGAAMGEAFRQSYGSDEDHPENVRLPDRLYGDVYHRPALHDRMESTASTIPPTPPSKDDELPPPVPLKGRSKSPEAREPIPPIQAKPTIETHQSTESGLTDFESDRLRREIVRSLSPEGDQRMSALTEESASAHTANRTSNALPSEYDSYWASGTDEKEAIPTQPATTNAVVSEHLPVSPPEPLSKSTSPRFLDNRFSWETKKEAEAAEAAANASIDSPVTSNADASSTLQPRVDPLSLNPKLSGEGLHIVNAEPGELPTPVEAPPRTSHEAPQLLQPSERDLDAGGANIEPLSPVSPIITSPAGPRSPSGPQSKIGEAARPASFREILAIKSTPARIAKYDETRHQFESANTGLDNWLSRTLSANPEHRDITTASYRPTMNAIGGSGPRHKATSSITRVFTKGDSPASSSYVDPSAEYKGGAISAGSEQRVPTGKSKDLGKDILKTAGVLGGKGMKEAKGLFSKGKSRFRGSGTEKDEEGSNSRPHTPSSPTFSSQDSRPPSSRRTSRSFSPFRRFSRRGSVIIPNQAEAVQDTVLYSKERPMSVPAARGQYWPEPESESVPRLHSSPTPESILHRSFTPPGTAYRLGVLPSPAAEQFTSDGLVNSSTTTQEDNFLESVVRHSTPVLTPPVDNDRTPTQTYGFPSGEGPVSMRAPNRANHHQRIVSLLQPEEIIPDNDKDDPVSPISPVEDSFPEDITRAVKPVDPAISPASPAVSMSAQSPASLKQNLVDGHLPLTSVVSRDNSVKTGKPENEDHHSVPRSRASTDSWERGSDAERPATNVAAPAAAAEVVSPVVDESVSEDEEPAKPKEPKGKEKVDDLAKLNGGGAMLAAMGHSRDSSVSSAIMEEAQAVAIKNPTTLEPTRHIPFKPTDRLKDPADRLAAIAEAHRKMRAQFDEEDAKQAAPHDFVVMESAAKKYDDYSVSLYNQRRASEVQNTLQVPSLQHGGRPRGSSIASTKTLPAGPSMIVTEAMPDVSPRTKSMGAAPKEAAVPVAPLLTVIPRTMPSVSSIGQEENKSSAEQSPIGSGPPVSPVKSTFETRDYHPPDPSRERPMSFIPLARDPSGLPVQELISTAKHPLDPESPHHSEEQQRTPTSGGIRRMSRQFDNAQTIPPGGPRRISRKFDEQGDTSPKGQRRRSRHTSLTMGAVQDIRLPSSEQLSSTPQTQSRPLSIEQQQPQPQSPPQPHSRSQSLEYIDPYRPVQLYDRPPSGASTNFPPPSSFQTIVNQNLRHTDLDVRHQAVVSPEPSVKPPIVDPLKKKGILQKLKGKTAPVPDTPKQMPPPIIMQQIAPPDTQRLQSIQSRTSTMGSQDAPNTKEKKKRGSGFFSGLKRPTSAGANSSLTAASEEGSVVHGNDTPAPQPQFLQNVVPPSPQDIQAKSASKSKQKVVPQRATTHTGQEPVGKKRFSGLGSLFGRSVTTGHTPNTGKKLSKEQPKGTIFHRVPDNPTTGAFEAQQRYHAAQWQNVAKQNGQHPPDLPLSPNQIGGIPPPPGGYYAPSNAPSNLQPQDNFGQRLGAAGYATIDQQHLPPSAPPAVNNTPPADARAGSNASSNHRWLFGRNSSTTSGEHLSPQVSAGSPMDPYQRENSLGGASISPVSTRTDSTPGQVYGRPRRGMRMGSITEAQHQERPWALTLPGTQDDDADREITRQEIFHAASARWQRGPDGLMYRLPSDQPPPNSPNSPQYMGSPMPTSPPPPLPAQGSPANPVYSYLPTQVSPPNAMPPSYQPTGAPVSIQSTPAQYQRIGYQPPSYPPPTAPDDPQIPSLPQPNLPLMQPQPKRFSYNGSPIASPGPKLEQAVQDPRTDSSLRSQSNVSAPSATASRSPPGTFAPTPPLEGIGSPSSPPKPSLGITTAFPMAVHQLPRSQSHSVPGSQHIVHQQQVPQSAHPASASSLYSAPLQNEDQTSSQLPEDLYGYPHGDSKTPDQDSDDERPPPLPKDTPPTSSAGQHVPLSEQKTPPVPTAPQAVSGQGLGGNNLAAALAQAGVQSGTGRVGLGHERTGSGESDDPPVMKAVSYPGDEWMPSWDGYD